MYAVILSGGKQYRVQKGDVLKLESLPGDEGTTITFDKILAVGEGQSLKMGAPYLDAAKIKVEAKVVSHGRHDKIHIIKFRRRKHHMKQQGHRQNYTEVEITQITA